MGLLSRLGLLAGAVCALLPAAPQAVLSGLPLRFEENRGQWNAAVRYTARLEGQSIQLTDGGPSFLVGGRRVALGLVHANPAPRIEPFDRMALGTNYLLGGRREWHTGVANFARLRYRDVYPGVDIVYYGSHGQLEYDFALQPGVSPDAIRMQFTGADSLSLTPEGDLTIAAGGARVLQKKPVIFQDGRRIAGRYTLLARNQAGLLLDAYDSARPLLIDPILVYAGYMGTSGQDQVTAAKMGPKGLLYITGSTNTGEFSTVDGAYSDHTLGLTDIFVAIVDTTDGNFTLKYFSYLGGGSLDIPLGLDVDSAGAVYLTGTTTSPDFPMAGSSLQTTGAGSSQQAFVAKLDPTKYGGDSLVYSTFLGGTTALNSGNGIAVDNTGRIYVVGTTRATDFPVTTSAYAGVIYGPQDAFITVIDPKSSSAVYSTYMGGELSDDGRAIAVGTNGLVYFAVSTYSTQFPMEGQGYRQTLQGGIDMALGVIDITRHGNGADGTPASMIYSTYFGGGDLDEVRALTLDANNNVILTGYTFSTDFPTTATAVQRNAPGNGDAFVSVLNPRDPPNFLKYSTYFGGSQGEVGYAVRPDAAGNIYLTGYTLSRDLFTVGAPQPGSGGGINMFVAQIKPNVAGRAGIGFCTYLGQTGTYVGKAVEVGADGSVYVAGYAQRGLPTWNDYRGGTSDGFLVVVK